MVRVVIEFDHDLDDTRVGKLCKELEKRGIQHECYHYSEVATAVETSDEYAGDVIEAAHKAGLEVARVYIPSEEKRRAAERLAAIERMTDEIRAELSAVDEVLRELRERLPAAVYEEVREKLEEMRRRVKKIADAIESNAEDVRRALWG